MLANAVWGEDAFEALYDRLGKQLSVGCGYLYEPMLQAARNSEQVRLGVLSALNGAACEDPKIAELAAEALRVIDAEVLIPHRNRMRELLDYWKRRGSGCERCKKAVLGSYCETCRVVPPEPGKHLVYLLFKAGALTFQDLLELAKEEGYGTADEARKALAQWAFADSNIMRGVIEQIDTGSAPGRQLNELLDQPVDQLKQNSDELSILLHSSSAAVRARLIDSFNSGWIVAHVARDWAQKALEDDSPLVRSAGAKFLRAQSQI